jgi:hypothetical protein
MNNETKPESEFKEWALLELFGHQRIAGLVTEAKIGSGAFVRVDVPDDLGKTRFTKFYNPSAIYAITPVDKQIAIGLAVSMAVEPVTRYDIAKLGLQPPPELPFRDEHCDEPI